MSTREDRYHQQRRKTPSFSSSLLDAIYRSFDESDCVEEHDEQVVMCSRETGTGTTLRRMKQRNVIKTSSERQNTCLEVDNEISSLRGAIMIEKWMGKHSNNTPHQSSSRHINSNSSSSTDSSCGGVFSSSSETESVYGSTPKLTNYAMQNYTRKRASEKTTIMQFEPRTPKREGRFTRTKSRAMKMYCDLKKVKQPISPGGRIASFLNSIFSAKTAKKKSKIIDENRDWSCSLRRSRSVKDSSTTASATTCLSATPFSNSSCLSKTPNPSATSSSSRGNKSKRSVRFFPVSVIVDEDCRPCGHKSIYEDDPSLMPTPIIRKYAELKNQHKSNGIRENFKTMNSNDFSYGKFHVVDGDDEDEDEDEDGESCSSSDLFELENIGAVGMGAYREELPVYGTTSINNNHAIASGLIL